MRISSLRMQNFRSHADTHIDLADEDRLVVVHGPNGSGKSTVLEAVLYSLYGETRLGPRGRVDRLVKRGREIEGLSVDMSFSLRGDSWRVVRERDRSRTAAVLYRDDQPWVEGTKAVNAELVGVLGHDAKSFRLAYLAEQKELDALGKMGAAERRRQVEKFLRLDIVQKAASEQQAAARTLRASLADMPKLVDLAPIRDEAARRKRLAADAAASLETAAASLDSVAAEVTELQAAAEHWSRRREELAAARTRCDITAAALEAAARAMSDALEPLEGVVVPDDTRLAVRDAQEALDAAQSALGKAREDNAGLQGRRQAAADLQAAHTRASELSSLLDGRDQESQAALVEAARTASAQASQSVKETSVLLDGCRTDLGRADSRVSAADARLADARSLSAVCEACRQSVPESHRHEQEHAAAQAAAAARQEASEAQAAVESAEAELAERSRRESQAAAEAAAASESLQETVRLADELSEVLSRVGTLSERVGAGSPPEPIDLVPLIAAAQAAEDALEEARRMHGLAAARDKAAGFLQCAKEDQVAAAASLASAQLPEEAVDVNEALAARLKDQSAASARHSAAVRAAAEAASAAAAAERAQKEASDAQRRRRRRVEQTEVAFRAAGLLDWLAREIGKSAAPKLETYASAALHRMTAGMFHKVSFDDAYSPTVHSSSGSWEFQDLSGGEQDAVALSVRLAAADIADSWSAGGTAERFLVLDEPLGSQDSDRRTSLVDYLQALKGEYGQIWCISHIGDLHEVADRLVELERVDSGDASVV